MKKNNGFTMAEVLVTLGIVSILTIVLIKTTNAVRPNQEQLMLKKAHNELSRIVHELVNDDELYPENESDGGNYLANTCKVIYKGKTYGSDDVSEASDATERPIAEAKARKFCQLVGSRLYISETPSNNCTSEPPSLDYTEAGVSQADFITRDGIEWVFSRTDFTTEKGLVEIDINGSQGDNCFEYERGEDSCSTPDRFRLIIEPDGRITVNNGDNLTKYYIMSPKATKKIKDLPDDVKDGSSEEIDLSISGNSGDDDSEVDGVAAADVE